MLISEQFAASGKSWAHFWDHPFGDELFLTASEGEEVQGMSLTARLRTTSRHPHHIAGASWRYRNLDLLTRGHEIFLQ